MKKLFRRIRSKQSDRRQERSQADLYQPPGPDVLKPTFSPKPRIEKSYSNNRRSRGSFRAPEPVPLVESDVSSNTSTPSTPSTVRSTPVKDLDLSPSRARAPSPPPRESPGRVLPSPTDEDDDRYWTAESSFTPQRRSSKHVLQVSPKKRAGGSALSRIVNRISSRSSSRISNYQDEDEIQIRSPDKNRSVLIRVNPTSPATPSTTSSRQRSTILSPQAATRSILRSLSPRRYDGVPYNNDDADYLNTFKSPDRYSSIMTDEHHSTISPDRYSSIMMSEEEDDGNTSTFSPFQGLSESLSEKAYPRQVQAMQQRAPPSDLTGNWKKTEDYDEGVDVDVDEYSQYSNTTGTTGASATTIETGLETTTTAGYTGITGDSSYVVSEAYMDTIDEDDHDDDTTTVQDSNARNFSRRRVRKETLLNVILLDTQALIKDLADLGSSCTGQCPAGESDDDDDDEDDNDSCSSVGEFRLRDVRGRSPGIRKRSRFRRKSH